MNLRRMTLPFYTLMIMFAIGAFEATSYAQFTVTVTGATPTGTPIPNGTSSPAPGGPLNVKATVANNSNTITKVVFYRNDVSYITDTSYPYEISQGPLGQETYTYHARAYDSTGAWADSNDYKLIFYSPRVIRMGDPNGPVTTHPPGRFQDHTQDIQNAVNWLGDPLRGGGTLFFPCTIPGDDGIAIYNIKSTIFIPPNVTLQGESAEEGGKCRIYWNDVLYNPSEPCTTSPTNLRNAPMFRIVGGTSRVRFRDLLLMSRTTGPWCANRSDWPFIATENTAAVELNTDDEEGVGDITDVIFENVTITHFTRGIKAVSNNESQAENEISGIKIRAFKPAGNTAALFIDAKYAYNWDIQNFNPAAIITGQGAVEIVNAGKPSVTDGENTKIKFLQLNCNGDRTTTAQPFCVKVQKHGGLYFRQLHHEGVPKAIIVEDISSRTGPNTNPDPIVFESSVASGEFNDASMKLYLIGNGITAAPETFQPGLDDNRLTFKGSGKNSTVVDCGDVHWDWTDINGGAPDTDDYMMLFSHSERYRGSFYAETTGGFYIKPHTYCPSGVSGSPNVDEIGGEFFDNGVLPNEPGLYANELNPVNCFAYCDVADELELLLAKGGSVYINGTFTLDRTVTIPPGSQIIGAPDAELILGVPNVPLFKIDVKILTQQNQGRVSGIVIRNLKLSTTQSNTTGIALIGEPDPNPPPEGPRPGVSSDFHFSGLTFNGFKTGLFAGPTPGHGHPMIDGVSMKNLSFVNNATAVVNTSANSSNWNVMNLSIQSITTDALGWTQISGGFQGLQDVTCTGTSTAVMKDCIKIQMVAGFFLNGLKQTNNVTNTLTVGENGNVGQDTIYQAPHPSTMVLRNSDFTGKSVNTGRMNVLGKAFITSMNNKYQYFNVESTYSGNVSRLTYCGDSYSGTAYPGLADLHNNLWVGLPTPTRIQCGTRPIPYDEAVRWTNDWDDDVVGTPLVANFFHDTQEDFVVYRPGSQSQFLIQQPGGPGRLTINWGMTGDIPLVGRFFPNSRAQIMIFRNGQWWVNDPNNSSNNQVFNWGMAGDKPFVGNFIDESSPTISGNKDEIAIYRPSDKTFWIFNPRSGAYFAFATTADNDSEIQIADFQGVGYDQIAQYKAGVWKIVNPRTWASFTINFGQSGDVPVAGKYLPTLASKDPCAQVGVWRPSTQEFLVADPFSNCGTRSTSLAWGSNNGSYPDDIPLTINAADAPLLRRPVAYRITKGVYDHSLADGQWWVHDLF